MEELAQRIELALSQSKSLEREARNLKQQLAGALELATLQLQAQGEENATDKEDRD